MKKLVRLSLLVLSLGVALVAVGLISLTWKSRADDICRERAPRAASDYSVAWEWDELAYVCDYRVPSGKPRRIGIVDAFHGGQKRRHGLDRRPR